jgi:hypothetical protein
MDVITVSLILMVAGGLLLVVSVFWRRRRHYLHKVIMEEEETQFDQKMRTFRVQHPDLPTIPADPRQYEGWWQEVARRIEIKAISKTLIEQQRLAKQVTDLHEEHLRYLKTTREINQTIRGINKDALDAEAAGKPPIVSEVDKIKAENDVIRARGEQMKLKSDLEQETIRFKNISNPPPPPKPQEPPKREGYAERVAREFREEQEAELKIWSEAEELARKFPDRKERIMREAQKKIEALKERR